MPEELIDNLPEPRPFLEDGSQFGISQTAFEEMEPDEQRELMVGWFHQNFEDPQMETPYVGDAGGYLYIWGGPFEAGDVLSQKFGEIVDEALFEEVVSEVQSDGTYDWAPTSNSVYYEHPDDDRDDDDEPPEPQDLEIYLDEPSDWYGSPQEREARAQAIEAIDNLKNVLETRRPIGIGHNRPPDQTGEPEEIKQLPEPLAQLTTELSKENPDIASVKREASALRKAVIATLKWIWKKVDGASSAVFNVSAVAGAGWLYNHPESIRLAYDAIIHWLDIAAKTVF